HIASLKSAYMRSRKNSPEKRIFAGSFHDSPPTRIAGDIHHWSKGPVQPDTSCLGRRDRRITLGHRGIPARRFRQRNGKDRAVTVNDIESEKDGNFESRFKCGTLKLIRIFGAA